MKKINEMFREAIIKIDDHIEMRYIQALSNVSGVKKIDGSKDLSTDLISNFLKKRGYVMNYILGRSVFVKGFTCACIHDGYVEVWHDVPNNNKSVFVNESLLTGLPITLNYMERI